MPSDEARKERELVMAQIYAEKINLHDHGEDEHRRVTCILLTYLKDAMQLRLSAQPKWTRVEDGLPDIKDGDQWGNVIWGNVLTPSATRILPWYSPSERMSSSHWMPVNYPPLPPPPKEVNSVESICIDIGCSGLDSQCPGNLHCEIIQKIICPKEQPHEPNHPIPGGIKMTSENTENKIENTESKIHIVFDGPPSQTAGRFVEVETPDGKGISYGNWKKREDGYWVLEIPHYDPIVLEKIQQELEIIFDFAEDHAKDHDKKCLCSWCALIYHQKNLPEEQKRFVRIRENEKERLKEFERIFNKIDLQKVGNLIGLVVGDSVLEHIQPYIEKLHRSIKRTKEETDILWRDANLKK